MPKYILLSFLLTFLTVSNVFSQQDMGADAQRAELKKLESVVGNWEGSGWIQQGPAKETFAGTETVQRKLDGLAFLVEGKFKSPEGKTIHETLAVISYDLRQKIYRFRTYLANGSTTGDQTITLTPDGWQWGFEFPGGKVRYIIKMTGTSWSETGEFSKDGTTWVKNFEMNLKKVK